MGDGEMVEVRDYFGALENWIQRRRCVQKSLGWLSIPKFYSTA